MTYQPSVLFSSYPQVLPNAHAPGLQPLRIWPVQHAVYTGVPPDPWTGSIPRTPAAYLPLPSAPATVLLSTAVMLPHAGGFRSEGQDSSCRQCVSHVLVTQAYFALPTAVDNFCLWLKAEVWALLPHLIALVRFCCCCSINTRYNCI